MDITVKLFATLREGRGKVIQFQADDGSSAAEILAALDISPSDVAILLINGFDQGPDTILQAGDVLSLFPPVGGG